jgi:hypothetical protein
VIEKFARLVQNKIDGGDLSERDFHNRHESGSTQQTTECSSDNQEKIDDIEIN